ncbi:MAG: hypothetical protein OJF47_001799 [Nitrospira sp.]|nr:MAG: hypothetical protein OJF47_001799 [Nitrospira sp.]
MTIQATLRDIVLAIGSSFVIGLTASAVLAIEQTPPTPSSPSSTSTAQQATTSASPSGSSPAMRTNGPTTRVYMPDGQLKSHSIRVYVTPDIPPNQHPRLRLLRSHAVTKKAVDEARREEPGLVAPGQEWVEVVDGQAVRRSGTLLLFDLSHLDFDYKAMLRVMPVVSWGEGANERIAVGEQEINVGNIVAAIGWTALVVGAAILIVILLSRRMGGSPLLLLTGVDGHLSLAQTQIACWTVAVGSVVLGYGFIKLEIPNIPTSLLALMGASLTTGGIAFFQDGKKQQTAITTGAAATPRTLALGDLIRVFPSGQASELSLAKAQMLFWTVLLLVLFLSKSILDGTIWEVPWGLVALMGFSQAGYLAPKLTP